MQLAHSAMRPAPTRWTPMPSHSRSSKNSPPRRRLQRFRNRPRTQEKPQLKECLNQRGGGAQPLVFSCPKIRQGEPALVSPCTLIPLGSGLPSLAVRQRQESSAEAAFGVVPKRPQSTTPPSWLRVQ